ncbi:TPA: signal recognition particle-docking protein FtsY, partial [Vibrio harveyi]|nr:signal recognition particle-docking protein FtsY [Vibrio harveyi]
MTEKKKRGLLSWLGFGDEEQSQKPTTEESVKEEAAEAPAAEQQPTEDVAEQAEEKTAVEVEPEKAEAA